MVPSSTPLPSMMISPAPKSDVPQADALTVREELLLVEFHASKIVTMCQRLNYPKKVQATSIAYLKRFYLYHTVMDYPPKDLVITCVYLACKVEEFNISLPDFARPLNVDEASVVSPELTLLDGLRYHLIVYSPYRALSALVSQCASLEPPIEILPGVEGQASALIDTALLTDLVLTTTPAQLALACLVEAVGEGLDISRLLEKQAASDADMETLLNTIKSIQVSLRTPPSINLQELQKIDAKLYFCRNPAMNPDSDLFVSLEAKKLKEKEEKRLKKLKKQQEKARSQQAALLGYDANGNKVDDGGEFRLSTNSSKRRKKDADSSAEPQPPVSRLSDASFRLSRPDSS
eukprot:GILI01025783.1.p1 GENE.GILI01025783.1~~GILI01025783.1.p1  ORF type:complete len:401 (+),score=100.86 GILI01025783.1:162-1205(+)